jgi:hypothetical protein
MSDHMLRRSFVSFHCVLAAVVFLQSIVTVLHTVSAGRSGHWLVWFAGAEAVAAVLFLVPATMRVGAIFLLLIFSVAIVLHGLQGELHLSLVVYIAGVVLVMAHGSAFGRRSSSSNDAARHRLRNHLGHTAGQHTSP